PIFQPVLTTRPPRAAYVGPPPAMSIPAWKPPHREPNSDVTGPRLGRTQPPTAGGAGPADPAAAAEENKSANFSFAQWITRPGRPASICANWLDPIPSVSPLNLSFNQPHGPLIMLLAFSFSQPPTWPSQPPPANAGTAPARAAARSRSTAPCP